MPRRRWKTQSMVSSEHSIGTVELFHRLSAVKKQPRETAFKDLRHRLKRLKCRVGRGRFRLKTFQLLTNLGHIHLSKKCVIRIEDRCSGIRARVFQSGLGQNVERRAIHESMQKWH